MYGKKHSEETKRKIAEARKKYKREKHPSWKGGKRITTQGYVEILKPEHHRARGNGYVFEHILVMEQKLNREIMVNEEVHHLDGDKENNHPDNLVVLNKSDHAKETARVRKERNMFPCTECGEKVYRKPYHRSKIKNIFCSRTCLGKWTFKNRKGVFKDAK